MLRSLALVLAALGACASPATPMDAAVGPWSQGLDLPTPRLEPGVTALGQRVVVLGGFDTNVQGGLRITRDVVALDQIANEWQPLTAAPVAWTHANLAGASTTLYLLGGTEGTDFLVHGEGYALDIDSQNPQWRELLAMPAGYERGAAAVVVSPPHIFLLGGVTTTAAVASCLVYNYSNDTWTILPDLPSPRSHAAAMRMADGTLIVAGGLATLSSTAPLDEVWALPQGASAWVPRAAMPTKRGGCAYGELFGHLVCAGGEAGAAALRVVERYDPATDAWDTLDPMPSQRAGTQGAVVGGRLYIPGGAASLDFEPTPSLFVFSLLDALGV